VHEQFTVRPEGEGIPAIAGEQSKSEPELLMHEQSKESEDEMANENRKGREEDVKNAFHNIYESASRLPAAGPLMAYRRWAMDLVNHLHQLTFGEVYKPRQQRQQATPHVTHGGPDVRFIDKEPMRVGHQIGPGVVMIPAADSEAAEGEYEGEHFIPGGPQGQVGVRMIPAGAKSKQPHGDAPAGGGTHPVPLERGGTVDVADNTTEVQEVTPGQQEDAVRHAEDSAYHGENKDK